MKEDTIIEIDLASIFKKLVKRWKLILLVSFLSAVLGIILSYGIPKKYKVVAKVAPELSLRTNSLTSLASMAGINMNLLSNNNDALLPTVYPEIVGSVPFITDLFEMPVSDSTLYDYVLNGRKRSWLGTIVALPSRAISALTGLIGNNVEELSDSLDVFHLTKEQTLIYKSVRNAIKVDVDKKTFIVTITVIEQDPVVAADITRNVIDNLKDYVTRYRTGKAQSTADFIEVSYMEAKDEYFLAQQRYAAYCDSHQELFGQRSQVEKQRLHDESNLKYQLYSSLAQQLQQARVTVQQESPVFAEVVPPTVPLGKNAPKRMGYAIVFAILGLLASCFYVLSKDKSVR